MDSTEQTSQIHPTHGHPAPTPAATADTVLSGEAQPDSGSAPVDPAMEGQRSLNPFVLVEDAAGFIDFCVAVFGGRELLAARTPTPDGLLIHAEVELGDSRLLIVDPQPGWAAHPGMLQLWVSDVTGVLARARDRGGVVVTEPTPFYGSIDLARLRDPWGNLWWLYQPVPGQADPVPHWEGGSDAVFSTLDAHLRQAERP